jgi:hypothetical protein
MCRASSCPLSGATTAAVAASGLPSELGGSSAVSRGRAGRANSAVTNCNDLGSITTLGHERYMRRRKTVRL